MKLPPFLTVDNVSWSRNASFFVHNLIYIIIYKKFYFLSSPILFVLNSNFLHPRSFQQTLTVLENYVVCKEACVIFQNSNNPVYCRVLTLVLYASWCLTISFNTIELLPPSTSRQTRCSVTLPKFRYFKLYCSFTNIQFSKWCQILYPRSSKTLQSWALGQNCTPWWSPYIWVRLTVMTSFAGNRLLAKYI